MPSLPPSCPKRVRNWTGFENGRLTVTGRAEDRFASDGTRRIYWLCQCSCGNLSEVLSCNIVKTFSCGCFARETARARETTHGLANTPIYRIWRAMHNRCSNPSQKGYSNYGGRGISVCERWARFEAFIEDMGMRPSDDHTIERKDNDGHYCPENCVWVTRLEQGRNKRNNHWVEYGDKRQTISEWSRELDLPRHLLSQRLQRGWSVKDALFQPSSWKKLEERR